MKSHVQYSKTQLSLLLIHLLCQISKKLFGESIPSGYVRTSLSADKTLQTAKQPSSDVCTHETPSYPINVPFVP